MFLHTAHQQCSDNSASSLCDFAEVAASRSAKFTQQSAGAEMSPATTFIRQSVVPARCSHLIADGKLGKFREGTIVAGALSGRKRDIDDENSRKLASGFKSAGEWQRARWREMEAMEGHRCVLGACRTHQGIRGLRPVAHSLGTGLLGKPIYRQMPRSRRQFCSEAASQWR